MLGFARTVDTRVSRCKAFDASRELVGLGAMLKGAPLQGVRQVDTCVALNKTQVQSTIRLAFTNECGWFAYLERAIPVSIVQGKA